jgi:zinc/manganese transport system substrate-binding protein
MLFMFMPASAYAAKLKVVASFSILGDMVHEVAGDNADIVTLVGPNGDAHMYEPSPADAKTLASADLVIVNGLHFEGWLGRLIVSSGYSGQPVLASKGIAPFELAGTMEQDPHAWQNVANAKIYVTNIRDAFIDKDSAHAEIYKANASRYLKQLDDLDTWVKQEIAKVPQQHRSFITTHDAFQYFAKAYGVTLHAPIGINTEGNASAADIAHLIDQIRVQHIQALFMENITDSRLIRQLETDGGAYVGGTLYSDALSAPEGPAGTYVKMITQNVTLMPRGMLHNQ